MSESPIAKQPIDTKLETNPVDALGVNPHVAKPQAGYLVALSISALGVVFGDIGTSPLYSLRECFHGEHGVAVTPENVFGVLSLVFWALIIVVSIKYLVFVLRADNRGEGGILALTALATPIKVLSHTERWWLIIFGIFGAALLYGDGMITPAISVLSAVEGLNVATHLFEPYVMPITVVILVGLFLIQRHGTHQIGRLFGPVMVVWFITIALLGIAGMLRHPGIIASLNPYYGYRFFVDHGFHGYLVLGSVFLVVTGGEALYADMGHFGRLPIRAAWFAVAMPALMLNYLGQGALLIVEPDAAANPFYELAPDWALYPLVILSTLATVIASQALISGAFSITMQATQLGLLPRLRIMHTSHTEFGQIYLPTINWLLMIGCILIVISFRTSERLASAYGVAVTSTMAITTVIFFIVIRERWHWSWLTSGCLSITFLVIDLAFLGANAFKILDGGWFPIVIAVVIFTVMTTWKRGRRILAKRLLENAYPVPDFLKKIDQERTLRVPGAAIFMSGSGDGVPPALLQNFAHNRIIHQTVLLLTVKTQQTPHVPEGDRVTVQVLGEGFFRVTINYGFMEDPDIPRDLSRAEHPGLEFDPASISYFLGREIILACDTNGGMALWRERLFSLMSLNASTPATYFRLPPDQVVELGSQVEI